MKPILLTVAGNPQNQDRGPVIEDGLRLVLCVADGAGGQSGGMQAAIMATEFVRQNASRTDTPDSCSELLRRMDATIAKDSVAGETTCAYAILTPAEIFGASVGDSGVWLIPAAGAHIDLSPEHTRKPFMCPRA